MNLTKINTERAEYGLPPINEAKAIAQKKGWYLHSISSTNKGMKAFEFRSIPGGGFSRTICAKTELDAAKALTRPRK